MPPTKWSWIIPLSIASLIFIEASRQAEGIASFGILLFAFLCFKVALDIWRGRFPGSEQYKEEGVSEVQTPTKFHDLPNS